MILDKQKAMNISSKIPQFYCEYSKVKIKQGQVVSSNRDGDTVIPVALYSSLILGPGTSITAEAAKAAFKRECVVIFAGGAGLPVHGITGNYRSPKGKITQAKKFIFHKSRLKSGKFLIFKRDSLCMENNLPRFSQDEVDRCESIENLLLIEARWTKTLFSHFSSKYNKERPKEFIKLANHFAYSAVLPPIIHMGLDPNIGVMHGKTRGGGLVFDIADIYKPIISVELAYSCDINDSANKIKAKFLNKIKDFNLQSKVIKTLEELYYENDI